MASSIMVTMHSDLIASAVLHLLETGFRVVRLVRSLVPVDAVFPAIHFDKTRSSLQSDIDSFVNIAPTVGCNDVVHLFASRCLRLAQDMDARLQADDSIEAGLDDNVEGSSHQLRSQWPEKSILVLERRLEEIKVDFELTILPILQSNQTSLVWSHDGGIPHEKGAIAAQRPEQTEYQGEIADALLQMTMTNVSVEAWTGSVNQLRSDRANILFDFFLDSLSFTAMRDREEEVTVAHGETFEWIYKKERSDFGAKFLEWLQADDQKNIFWINGKAGSGKSTLLRYIAENKRTRKALGSWVEKDRLIMATFYFWTSGSSPEQRSQAGLLRSILHQSLDHYRELIPNTFPRLWRHFWSMKTQDRIKATVSWTITDLMRGFRNYLTAALVEARVCLFVDGMDEFEGDHKELIGLFQSLADDAKFSGKLKFCVSSRPWPAFVEAYQDFPNLKLQDLTLNDMRKFTVDSFVADDKMCRLLQSDATRAKRLIEDLVCKADGVFLWVSLAVQCIIKGVGELDASERQLAWTILDQVPGDLDELFRYKLFECQSRDQIIQASRVFQLMRAREQVSELTGEHAASSLVLWEVCLAEQPNRPLPMDDAIEMPKDSWIMSLCESMEKRIEWSCAGLIKIHTVTKFLKVGGHLQKTTQRRITYLHRTIRDYLVLSGDGQRLRDAIKEFDPHLQHLVAAVLSLRYPLESFNPSRRIDDWYDSVTLALSHARYVQNDKDKQRSCHRLLDKLNDTVACWWKPKKQMRMPNKPGFNLRGAGLFDDNPSEDTWATATFGQLELRKNVIISEPYLALATKFGVASYVRQRLETRKLDYRGGAPLLTHALEFLVSRKLTIMPLSNPELVKAILDLGGDPNQMYKSAKDASEETPWLWALKLVREAHRRGFISHFDLDGDGVSRWCRILEMLLEAGADIDALIRADQFDPAISALDVLKLVNSDFKSAPTMRVQHLLEKRGARSTQVLMDEFLKNKQARN